jgi:hypothetical protein
MADEFWKRFLGIMAAAFLAIYGAVGVLRDDLDASLSKSGRGVHLHGPLAWLCFAGMIVMSIAAIRIFGPAPGVGKFNFDERRIRFGPLFGIGLVLYATSQIIGNWP